MTNSQAEEQQNAEDSNAEDSPRNNERQVTQREAASQQGAGPSSIVVVAKKLVFPLTPKKISIFSFYFLGIFLCLFAHPAPLPMEVVSEFSDRLHSAEHVPGLGEAEAVLMEAQMELRDVHVWFWQHRHPYNTLVPEKRALVKDAERVWQGLERQRQQQLREARATVGVWSSFCVEGVRELFWKSVESGKMFAKRQTFWKGLWLVLESRDGSIAKFLLDWALALVSNFTIGLIGALISFLWQMPSLIYSFAPDVFSGTLFFMLAAVAAVSMVLTYLLGIYSATAGAVYCMAQVVKNNPQLLEGGRRRQARRQYIRAGPYGAAGYGGMPPRGGAGMHGRNFHYE